MPLQPTADFESLLRAFDERGIRFIVIGGVSAALQGVPAVTYDLDLVLDPESENLDRAYSLLQELEACLREHLPAMRLALERNDLETTGAKLLMSRLGPVDILGELSTGWRVEDLDNRTRLVIFDEKFRIRVLDLASLIELKEKIGREKDLAVLPLYRRVLLERDQQEKND
jgi:predicted nucleotidyltransferase